MSSVTSVLRRPGGAGFSFGFDRFSGLYLWALFIVVFGLWVPETFLTGDTAHSVASDQAIVAMLGLALLVPLAAGAYDLSIGANINLCAVLVAQLQTKNDWNMWAAILATIGVGLVIGAVNGFIVVKLKVNSFIATLGTATIIGAFITIVTNQSQPLPPTSSTWLNLTQYSVLGFQIVFVYVIVLGLLFWWALDHTPAGRYVYAVGGNTEAARLSGVKVGKWTFLSLVTLATTAAVAGVFYSSLNGPSLTFGGGLLLPAFAAAFLGSTQLKPGRFNVWGTLIAVYVLATGVKGLQLVTTAQWLNDMFNGIALIVAVAFAVWRQGVTRKKKRVSELEAREGSSDQTQPATSAPDRAGIL